MTLAQKVFKVGDRVFDRLSRWHGTVLAMPGAHSGPPDLFAVLDDAGELHAVHPTLLEPTGEADGLAISRQRLQAKREALFEEMVRIVASCQRVDLGDPTAKRRIEDLMRQMSASWSDAEATKLRKKVFVTPELRRLLTRFLETGELIDELGDVLDGTR